MADDLKELIARLERADGPLTHGGVAMLFAALSGTRVRRFSIHRGDGGEDEMHIEFVGGATGNFSEYDWPDRSLDAALKFVPEDCTVYLTRPNQTNPIKEKCLSFACVAPKGLGGPQFSRKRAHLSSYHAFLPLALCIAILKALSHG